MKSSNNNSLNSINSSDFNQFFTYKSINQTYCVPIEFLGEYYTQIPQYSNYYR